MRSEIYGSLTIHSFVNCFLFDIYLNRFVANFYFFLI